MDALTLHSIWTVLMFILFIGIVIWAFSGKRKQSFKEAAQLPLEDEEYVERAGKSGDKHHG